MQFYRVVILAVILLLAGCGGGGGSSSPPPTPAPTPQAVADTATIDEDSTISIDVLANDISINAATLAVSQSPANGTASVVGNNIEYIPAANFSGTDSLEYTVNATSGATLSAIVNITVNSINDVPVANADNVNVVENTPTSLNVVSNDTDADGTIIGITIVTNPSNGSIQTSGTTATYTPNNNFTGPDSFQYSVIDNDSGTSNVATVSITVNPITITNLSVTSLVIPTTNYNQLNNPQLGTVLTSPDATFTLPANTVSYSITLQGDDVAFSGTNLFVAGLVDPSGIPVNNFVRNVAFCDPGLCGALIPRTPLISAPAGNWSYTTGTLSSSLDSIDITNMALDIAIRTGPEPDLTADFPAQLTVKPFLTATTVDANDISQVLNQFESIANANGIALVIEPLTVLTDARFTEVPSDFNSVDTAALVSMGDAQAINIFFLESFSGFGGSGLIGIAGGLPGTMGIKGKFNGVLINATATHGGPDAFYARTTAEFAFHEMGHFIGLYHTTEKLFDEFDVLADTPECPASMDFNNNGIADTDECPDGLNIMFWNYDFSEVKDIMTSGQKGVFYYSPLAKP